MSRPLEGGWKQVGRALERALEAISDSDVLEWLGPVATGLKARFWEAALTNEERQRLEALYDRLPTADRDDLLAIIPELRGRRLIERNAEIQRLASFYPAMSTRTRAAAIAQDLKRLQAVAATGAPDPKRASLSRVLNLNAGSALGSRMIFDILVRNFVQSGPSKLHTERRNIAS